LAGSSPPEAAAVHRSGEGDHRFGRVPRDAWYHHAYLHRGEHAVWGADDRGQGKYYVDWGDGTHTGPHSREGGPWPDGEIKHQYINIGAYDVVVTERWTATWSFGSESGRLDELRTVGRIEDFPVGQIQAVVYQ